MKRRTTIINLIITLTYFILVGILIVTIFTLPDKYNKEEMDMVMEVEKRISEALEEPTVKAMNQKLTQAREDYRFDVVVANDYDVLYRSVPYEIGDSLLNRIHEDAIARQSQLTYPRNQEDVFVWYAIYRLSDSVFINSFLMSIIVIVAVVTILIGITVTLMFKSLFDPLKNIKQSLEFASDYEFSKITESEDDVNHKFKDFVSRLEDDISVVSRQHTELEKQLQAKREHLNNVVVVSRSMVHDLKTPVHRTILENEIAARDHSNDKIAVEIAEMNRKLNDSLMLDINRILKMLKNDSEGFQFEKSDVDVVDTITRALGSFNQTMVEKKLKLDFEADEYVVLHTEESTLILLINNLLSNMILYSNEGSQVGINVEVKNKQLVLSFKNESSKKNIERMRNTEQLFNTIRKDDDAGYTYSSGNGLYLIKELTAMLNGHYNLVTHETEVIIEVSFDYE